MRELTALILIAATLGCAPAAQARYSYDAPGQRAVATIGAVTTRFYYDGQRVIEERDAGDAVVRYHVNGGQFIDERIATYDVSAAGWTYYLHGVNYSVIGQGDASGVQVEPLEYTSGGVFGPLCRKADSNCDWVVNFNDLDAFVTALSSQANWESRYDCDYFCVNDVNEDQAVDFNDMDPFVSCLASGCGFGGGTTPETGMFTLHGRPIDVLGDGKVLMDFRTRIYDPQHGRWLQRDRAGYADGPNLYKSFRNNAQRFTDPEGKYTKLASGWNQGDDVVYQRFPWLWSSAPSDTFSVGRYYYHEGQKLIVYDDPFEEYAYVLPFEGVEQWSRGVRDSFDYREFTTKRGLRVDRTSGKVLKRSTAENIQLWLEDEVAARSINIDFLDPVVFFAGPAFTTLTAETAPGLIVEDTRTVTRLEYGLAAGTTVLQVVPIAQLGTRSFGSGTGIITRGLPITAESSVRARVLANIAESQAARSASRSLSNRGLGMKCIFPPFFERVQADGCV